MVRILSMDGISGSCQCTVPRLDITPKPLGVKIVLIAQFPHQNSGMVLELFDIFNECSGSDVEGAALIVTETHDDAQTGLTDFVEHLF